MPIYGRQNGQAKDLLGIDKGDMAKVDSLVPACESMDMTTARIVLNVVVNTHENTFREGSDLSKVGGHSTEQVREALRLVAADIIKTHGVKDRSFGLSTAEKETPSGKLSLTMYHGYSNQPPHEQTEPENLNMSLINAGNFVLESEVPLRESDSWVHQDSVRFADFRRVGLSVVSMYDIKQGFTIDKFRVIWRGMRWLSANMLGWNEDFKLPEDLGKLSLPANRNIPRLKKARSSR